MTTASPRPGKSLALKILPSLEPKNQPNDPSLASKSFVSNILPISPLSSRFCERKNRAIRRNLLVSNILRIRQKKNERRFNPASPLFTRYCPQNIENNRSFPHSAANSPIPIDQNGEADSPAKHAFAIRQYTPFAIAVIAFLFALTGYSSAQALRGTLVHEQSIRVSPSADSAKLATAERGHELIVIESSRDWTHVQAILREPSQDEDADDEEAQGKTVTGWIRSNALVTSNTPNGDRIIFGEAVDSEDQASRRRGRRDAAQDAMRLYYRVYDLFPTSPIAGEGLYRAADIRWQMDRADIMTRPSAREREAYMRGQIPEDYMKLVIKKFPGTKWADRAAFHLIENKLCGDWQAASKCPEKESDLYEKYAKEHPNSPAAPEALYDAAWRQSALIEIYKTEANLKKSGEAKARALDLAQRVVSQFPTGDWALRAQDLIFYIQQGVPTYGNAGD